MVTNDVAGNLLPYMIVVKGKTFKTLEKFTLGNYVKWNAPGPHLNTAGWTKFLLDLRSKNGCTNNFGTLLHSVHCPSLYCPLYCLH
jgi:hypothetical protein